jgi:hypothetical protein
MEKDPFKHRAPREEDKAFRALFGCAPVIVLTVWNKLSSADLIPHKGTMTQLLWTLMYCKQYGKWSTMSKLTNGTDPKTLRKWIYQFLYNIEQLEWSVVSFGVPNSLFCHVAVHCFPCCNYGGGRSNGRTGRKETD